MKTPSTSLSLPSTSLSSGPVSLDLGMFALAEGYIYAPYRESRLCKDPAAYLPLLWDFIDPEENLKLIISKSHLRFSPPMEIRLESGLHYVLRRIQRRAHTAPIEGRTKTFWTWHLKYTLQIPGLPPRKL